MCGGRSCAWYEMSPPPRGVVDFRSRVECVFHPSSRVCFPSQGCVFSKASTSPGCYAHRMTTVKDEIVEIVAGGSHTCVLLTDRQIKCWGSGAYGQLGNGMTSNVGTRLESLENLRRVQLGTGRNVTKISLGGRHTCVILDRGDLKCFGWNYYGQLGLEDTINRGDDKEQRMGDALPILDLGTGRTAIEVAAGSSHTCVLLDDHSVKCFGQNNYGQLGLGDTDNRGGRVHTMGDALPNVPFGRHGKPIDVVAGAYHTCVLLAPSACFEQPCAMPNKVVCFGLGKYGLLGLGATMNIGDHPQELGDHLRPVKIGTNESVANISTGSYHTCVILLSRRIKCWGRNDKGQLGTGSLGSIGDRPGEMGDTLAFAALGKNRSVLDLTLGEYFTCVLLDIGDVKCFGDNQYGQLGYGDKKTRGDKQSTVGDRLHRVRFQDSANKSVLSMTAGDSFCCALFNDFTAECWGRNDYGQLGLGDIVSHNSPVKVSWIGRNKGQRIVQVDDTPMTHARAPLLDASPTHLLLIVALLGIASAALCVYCKYFGPRKRMATVPLETVVTDSS